MAKEPAAQKAQLDCRSKIASKNLSRPKTRRIISIISSGVALVIKFKHFLFGFFIIRLLLDTYFKIKEK